MNNQVVITLACGTDNPNRATRAIFLAPENELLDNARLAGAAELIRLACDGTVISL